MANCKYCTNYYLNSNDRVDDCCLGYGDCRKDFFSCNERLKSRITKTDDTQNLIKELEKRGYKVTKK